MEKTQKFQIIYVARTNSVPKPTDHARYLMKLWFPQLPHYPIGVKRVHVSSPNVECSLSNILELIAMFLYSIYHQWAGKLISFIWEGVDFTLGIRYIPLTCCFPFCVVACKRRPHHHRSLVLIAGDGERVTQCGLPESRRWRTGGKVLVFSAFVWNVLQMFTRNLPYWANVVQKSVLCWYPGKQRRKQRCFV